jgi:hypothetical protein
MKSMLRAIAAVSIALGGCAIEHEGQGDEAWRPYDPLDGIRRPHHLSASSLFMITGEKR